MRADRIVFENMPWEKSPNGARFKIWKSEPRQLRLLSFGTDLVHPEWCTRGHAGMILEGSMEVEFCDGRRIQFHAGDGLYIESGLESRHRPVALTDEVRMVFVENLDP